MTKADIYQKYKSWASRCNFAATACDLDNAAELLSYDAKEGRDTLSGISVRAIAVHTDRVHVFLFAVRTVWAKDRFGDAGDVVKADYKLIAAF